MRTSIYGAENAMGIFDKIRGEFIDIIEWLDDSQDVMVYRFERYNNEIKNGAQLVVRESQVAVLVDQGQIADVYAPGRHELTTQNMPILSTLRGWKYGFNSPFKCEVYFANTKRFTDLKWGTMNPVMMRDADFGVVRVRAFGTYACKVRDASKFLREIAGTDWQFTTDEVNEHMRNQIVSRFSETVSMMGIPVIDLSTKYTELGAKIKDAVAPLMDEIGVELLNFNVENVSVPEEVEKVIDSKSGMGIVGGNLNQYTQFQAAQSMQTAAENPGGGGAAGIGLGAGMAMGQIMQQSMVNPPPQQSATPPPVPQAVQVHFALNGASQGPFTLEQAQQMIADGTVNRQTLAWTAGMANWIPAGDMDATKNLFGAVPPPLPPQ